MKQYHTILRHLGFTHDQRKTRNKCYDTGARIDVSILTCNLKRMRGKTLWYDRRSEYTRSLQIRTRELHRLITEIR